MAARKPPRSSGETAILEHVHKLSRAQTNTASVCMSTEVASGGFGVKKKQKEIFFQSLGGGVAESPRPLGFSIFRRKSGDRRRDKRRGKGLTGFAESQPRTKETGFPFFISSRIVNS